VGGGGPMQRSPLDSRPAAKEGTHRDLDGWRGSPIEISMGTALGGAPFQAPTFRNGGEIEGERTKEIQRQRQGSSSSSAFLCLFLLVLCLFLLGCGLGRETGRGTGEGRDGEGRESADKATLAERLRRRLV
jgi:hypothetical protein